MTPTTLEHLLRTLLEEVRIHPQHVLWPYQRYLVYEQLGRLEEPAGYQRHGWLGLTTAEYVLPIWQQARPQDDHMQRLLQLTNEVIEHKADTKAAEQVAEQVWDMLVNAVDNTGYGQDVQATPQAASALLAATVALQLTLGVDVSYWWLDLDAEENAEEERESETDPWTTDVAGWAVHAYAYDGKPLWKNLNKDKQLEFWTWWLTEAVPAAWAKAP